MTITLPDGLNMYYEYKQSDLQKKTLVFLNGLSQSTLVWHPMSTFFAQHYNVLLIDQIFQGQSDKTGAMRSFEQHARDIIYLLDNLGLEKVFVVGISYGGAIAQRLLVNHSERIDRAMLVSTFAHKTAQFNYMGAAWKRALEIGGYDLMLDVMLPSVLGESYFENPLIPIETMREMRNGINVAAEPLLKLMEATEQSGDYRPSLAQVKQAVMVVQGEQDILTTPKMGKAIADALPQAIFKIIPAKGHSLNIEAIPELSQLVLSFGKQ
ncbi:MAG: alpha/beta fold hydrolase [Bernardetiaceae bacterium]|nr:alpha/beta fold hydrolase [Bernardetiaceae bacterium]